MTDQKHSHYFRDFPWEKIDVYRLIEVYEITCPAAQHILKKVIATGKRGHKDLERDWQDILDTAQRKIDMLQEDAACGASALTQTHKHVGTEVTVTGYPEQYSVPCGYVPTGRYPA